MPDLDETRFVETLRSHSVLNVEQVSRVVEASRETSTRLLPTILQLGLVLEDELFHHLAEHLGLTLTRVSDIDNGLAQDLDLSLDFLERAKIVPVRQEDGVLVVASARIDCFSELASLAYALDLQVAFALATPSTISASLAAMRALVPDLQQSVATTSDLERLRALANEGPIISLANSVFNNAVMTKASDVHIEATETGGRIRFRVHGEMHVHRILSEREVLAVVSRIKVMSGLNISEKRLPQDGRAQVVVRGGQVDLRVACLPTQFGESVVIRLLDRRQLVLEWDTLGFDPEAARRIQDIVNLPNGLFLVAGPTGSGKTTTLYTALSGLNSEARKIVTVEDPIEFSLPGISQVAVDTERELGFARALRAILRQDPDVIMIGEIRDEETAAIAVRAALVGRMVLSTIHTNNGPSTVTRLLDLGVERFLLRDTLKGVLSQRLEPIVCDLCRGAGCQNCGEKGKLGRRVVFDLLDVGAVVVQLQPMATRS